jgi:RNA polymerase sigma-70 factor (ECF subfamily)
VKENITERARVVANQTAEIELTLIQQAGNGDSNAFGELVRRHYAPIVNVVYRMCGDANLAEDMAQETFLRAWSNLASFRPKASLRHWLYRIAVNATLDVLRRKTEEPVEDEFIQMVSDQSPGPEATVIEKEQAADLQKKLKSLPEASRTVLVLREYGGLSYQEIATTLELPVGTVMSRLNYARTRLREMLKEQMREEYNHA